MKAQMSEMQSTNAKFHERMRGLHSELEAFKKRDRERDKHMSMLEEALEKSDASATDATSSKLTEGTSGKESLSNATSCGSETRYQDVASLADQIPLLVKSLRDVLAEAKSASVPRGNEISNSRKPSQPMNDTIQNQAVTPSVDFRFPVQELEDEPELSGKEYKKESEASSQMHPPNSEPKRGVDFVSSPILLEPDCETGWLTDSETAAKEKVGDHLGQQRRSGGRLKSSSAVPPDSLVSATISPTKADTGVASSHGRTLVLGFDGPGHASRGVSQFVRLLSEDDPSKQVVYVEHRTVPYAKNMELTWKAHELFNVTLEGLVTGAYQFLMDKYRPGDRINLFGFSRGGHIARCLAGMLLSLGLLNQGHGDHLHYGYQLYLMTDWKAWCSFKRLYSRNVQINFVGIWDSDVNIPRWLPQIKAIEVLRSQDSSGATTCTDPRHVYWNSRICLRWIVRKCFQANAGIIFNRGRLSNLILGPREWCPKHPVIRDGGENSKSIDAEDWRWSIHLHELLDDRHLGGDRVWRESALYHVRRGMTPPG